MSFLTPISKFSQTVYLVLSVLLDCRSAALLAMSVLLEGVEQEQSGETAEPREGVKEFE